ncbi:uncharacterized protein LOC131630859 [Vicia villosa]|uniref:uncharacterized protein LOC131630859 n=1 Tax=Vicia villosa TaxID=3911 RepID=UPI00273A755F|nr:uncharacterized protein LOC131630859 [Vicia villosa]
MLAAWNVRGLNKVGKLWEVSSHLFKLQPDVIVLIETRVKENKASGVRNKLGLKGDYINKYCHLGNWRVWIKWNPNKVIIIDVTSSSQFIHCGVYAVDGNFKFWMTSIYAHNNLTHRKRLWKDLEDIHKNQQGPWCAVEDFNNVASSQDRIGGNLVTEIAYEDFQAMMDITGLGEMDITGEFFTWTNKKASNPIYSRIDRLLANVEWLHENSQVVLTILPPHVSDHEILYLTTPGENYGRGQFRFNNCWVNAVGYLECVERNWAQPTRGTPMQKLWFKLKRLKPDLVKLQKQSNDIQNKKTKARKMMDRAYEELRCHKMDPNIIGIVKERTKAVIYWNEMEEKMMQQRTKIESIRLGDGNNAYLHAFLKSKHSSQRMSIIQKEDRTLPTTQDDIAQEVMDFYRKLMGQDSTRLHQVDIEALTAGSQFNKGKREMLVSKVTIEEIEKALQGNGELKSPGVDG